MITWAMTYVKKGRYYDTMDLSTKKPKKGIEDLPIGLIMAAKRKAKDNYDKSIGRKVCPICHQLQALDGSCSCDPAERFEALCALQNRLMAK